MSLFVPNVKYFVIRGIASLTFTTMLEHLVKRKAKYIYDNCLFFINNIDNVENNEEEEFETAGN